MDVKDIKRHLSENTDDLIKILKHFKFHSITIKNNNLFCGKPNGDSPISVSVKLDEKLTSSSFSISYHGDLFGMICETHNMEWIDTLYISEMIINKKIESENQVNIFDGFLDNAYISKKHELITYEESMLNEYEHIWNARFVNDYIVPKVQKLFEIGYSAMDDRISIPWRNDEGKLLGVIGRANYKTDLRYFPLIPFLKSHSLYGIHIVKKYINKTKTAYIGESEKFTLQLYSYGYKNGVSLGCSTVSSHQVELLLKHGCKNFILCMDEGSNDKVIKRNIKMIKDSLFMRDDCKIGVLIDRNNDIIKKDTKCSPSDLGKIKFEELISDYVEWEII